MSIQPSSLVTTASSSIPRVAYPPPHPFTCNRRAESGSSIHLLLSGELDLSGETRFRAALESAQEDADRVLLELATLRLIDCSGLAVLFGGARRADREGAALVLMHPCGQVRRLLDLVGAPAGVTVIAQEALPAIREKAAA
jgi:anti-anti-sigma factor